MSKKDKYVAYVGTYTHENSVGIHVYDVDIKDGTMQERSVAKINNPSYLTVSADGEFVYSIADEGVAAFKIDKKGDLTMVNQKWIGGMRGCYVAVDKKRRFLFVGGYHDGRVTMMKLNEDGSIGEIADGIFHQGLGISSVEQRLEPKVTCVELSPDEKYLFAVDLGMDQVKIYEVDYENGKLRLQDIIRCSFGEAPRMLRFSKDGKFVYLLSEKRNKIVVYSMTSGQRGLEFEKIQTIGVLKESYITAAASTLELSDDEKHMFVSVDAENVVTCMERDETTGKLTFLFTAKTSGDYPKTIAVFPGGKYYVALNHDSNDIRGFEVDYDGNFCLMRKPPVKIEQPNCIKLHHIIDR